MIKKYRNALLVAAVASVTVGCGGASDGGENPLNNPNLVGNITNKDAVTHRAIAQLLGTAFSELIGATSTVFGAMDTMTDSQGTIGKALSPIISGGATSAKATGVAADASTACALGGKVDFNLQLDFDGSLDDLDSLDVLKEQPIDAGITFKYAACNEPRHTSYTPDGTSAPDTPVLETDEDGKMINNVMNGVFSISLRSSTGSAANANDYSLSSTMEMKDYFIQRYSEGTTAPRPSVINGAIDLSLVTTTGTDYLLSMATATTNNNEATGGFVKSSILAEGEVKLTEDFAFETYDLGVDAKLRNFTVSKNEEYHVYTNANLVRTATDTGGTPLMGVLPQPSAGELGISMTDGGMGTATVTPTGIHIISVIDGVETESDCTWAQVNGENGASCDGL